MRVIQTTFESVFMKRFVLVIFLLSVFSLSSVFSQTAKPYQTEAKNITSAGLRSCMAYKILEELSVGIGPRLSGSPNAAKAIEWGKKKMEELGFDNVHLEPVMVPHWVRGSVEEATVIPSSGKEIPVAMCALGGSIATPENGITAEVIEVKSFDELHALGEKAKGKIVFFNRPMDPTKINTFEAYGGAVDQRFSGAAEAAKVGGVAAVVRSMSTRLDNVPHTGMMGYVDSIPKVPTGALSTLASNMLDSLLAVDPHCKIRIKLSCETLPDVESANVVGELKGTEKPEEIIVVGGHIDSWDKGRGAHDDGAGVAQSIETLRLLKELGLKPKRTIRAVLFINEENGDRGGIAYGKKDRPGEHHIAAIETDAGGFTPKGIGVSADSIAFGNIARWSYLFEPLGGKITKGGGGTDISELGKQKVITMGLNVDSQRYFDYHHSDSDTIDKVNERELELGAISLAIITYVLAQEGI